MNRSGQLRVGVDMSIARHGPSGSLRWAEGLAGALGQRPDVQLHAWTGPPRRHWRNVMRKPVNALQERLYYELMLPRAARAWGADVLLMPVNLTAHRSAPPQVVSILDLNFLVEPDTYDPWYRRYATRMFTRATRDATIVTTISEHSRAQLQARLSVPPDRVRVVYPGLTPPPSSGAPPPASGRYALFVSATEPHKNADLLIDAWSGRRPPPLDLVIAGRPGRAHRSLVSRAALLGGRVVVRGTVSDRELEALYAGATVFLFPSLTEGFGFPPLEAMARGVPVISSDAACMPEVLGDAALYHDPRDVDGLLHQLDRLLGDPVLADHCRRVGRARAAGFTWRAAAERMIGALRDAASGASA